MNRTASTIALLLILTLSSEALANYRDEAFALNPVSYYALDEPFPTVDVNGDFFIDVFDAVGTVAIDSTGNCNGIYGIDNGNYPGSAPWAGTDPCNFIGMNYGSSASFYGGIMENQPEGAPDFSYPDGVDGILIDTGGAWDNPTLTYNLFFRADPDNLGWNATRMISNEDAATNDLRLLMTDSGNLLAVADDMGISGWDSAVKITDASFADNEWHMATVVRTGEVSSSGVAERRLYVDGVEVATHYDPTLLAQSKDPSGSTTTARLGQRSVNTGWGGFVGDLDEVGIWDYALTDEQIADLWYEANHYRDPWWRPPGDANHDGIVDVVDLGILAGNWQQTDVGQSGGDFNDDGIVDVIDLGILAIGWHQTGYASSNSQIPEPATMTLILLATLPLPRRRKVVPHSMACRSPARCAI